MFNLCYNGISLRIGGQQTATNLLNLFGSAALEFQVASSPDNIIRSDFISCIVHKNWSRRKLSWSQLKVLGSYPTAVYWASVPQVCSYLPTGAVYDSLALDFSDYGQIKILYFQPTSLTNISYLQSVVTGVKLLCCGVYLFYTCETVVCKFLQFYSS